MKIKVADYINLVTNEAYQKHISKQKISDLSQVDIHSVVSFLLESVKTDLSNTQLSQAIVALNCNQQEVQIRLETSIINLPFTNINRVDNFFDELNEAPVGLYLIVVADKINKSHFRIDKLADIDDLVNDYDAVYSKLSDMLGEKIKTIIDNENSADEEE